MKSRKVKIRDLATLVKSTWSPKKETSLLVAHYSLPAFDSGRAEIVSPSEIQSNKQLFDEGVILLSKLNPGTQRIWLVENRSLHPMVASGEFLVLKPRESPELQFIYQLLKSPDIREQMLGLSTGTSNSHQRFRPENFLDIEVEVINDENQRKSIATFLKALDDKIHLNTEISKTLEAIAQAIFKSWFIDFDPVHAKMRGEKPEGMDDATAALFPDSFEESELGLIPKGYHNSTIGGSCAVIDCLHAKKPTLLTEGFPYLQLNTIHDNGVLRTEFSAYISTDDYKKWTGRIEVRHGDCLITNVGRVGAVSQVPEGFSAAIGRNITAIRPDKVIGPTFLISLLLSEAMKSEIQYWTDSGTILDALNVKSIPKLRYTSSTPDLMLKFEQVVGPLRTRMNQIAQENITIAKIRDALLPRLISGELEIPHEMLAS
jgi:type I restriction enzyme S subunit